MSIKFVSIPPKKLSQSILSTDSSFKLSDIKGWDGNDLTSADFGTQSFAAFLSSDNTQLEIMEIDPSTIASTSITIVYRGLKFDGTQSTEVTANKLDWPAGITVQIGSDIPQLLTKLGLLENAQTWNALQTFTVLPESDGGNATTDKQLITYVQAVAMATGTTNINRIVVAGNGGETITAGQLVYLKVLDGEWYLSDADIAGTVDNIILGITQGAGSDGVAITSGVLLFGLDSNQTGLTNNTLYYASNTAGGISSSIGTIEVSVGVSRSTTSLLFYPRYNQQITENQHDALAGNNTDVAVGSGNKYVTQTGLQHNAEKYAADAGTTDTYVITLSPVPTSYTNGMIVHFKANTVNTGAATLNVNSLGAKTIVKEYNTTLADGDIKAGQLVSVIYDGTNFQMLSPVGVAPITIPPIFSNGTFSKLDDEASIVQTIAHGLGKIPKKVTIVGRTAFNLENEFTKTTYNGTTQSSIYAYKTAGGTYQGFDFAIADSGGYGRNVGVVTFDATNITITWTYTSATGGVTFVFLWEAEA